jgi:predicted transcriptional regulator
MKTLGFDLTDEEHALLSDLATYLDHTPESLLRRSISRLLGEHRAKLAFIEDGRRSGEEEGWIDAEDVWREMDQLMEENDARKLAPAE